MAQPGSALAWGARGRRFKSSRPDHSSRATAAHRPVPSTRSRAATWAYRIGAAFVRTVPPRVSYLVADTVAAACLLLRPFERTALNENLRRVLPHAAPRAGIVFRHFARTVVDFLGLPVWSRSALLRAVRVEDPDVLRRAVAEARGVVIASGHLGSWEVGAAYLAARGYTVVAPARAHRAPGVEQFFSRARARCGVTSVPVGSSARTLLAALRRGECVALLSDRPRASAHAPTPFFGQPAHLPSGHVGLALRARAPLVVGAAIRDAEGFRIVWERVPLEDLGVRDSAEGMRRATAALERLIARAPSQWYAFERIWANTA